MSANTTTVAKKRSTFSLGSILGRAGSTLILAFIVLWIAFGVFALFWLIITSLKTNRELFTTSVWSLPAKAMWENYRHAWVASRIGKYFLNSIIVSVVSVGVLAVIGSMAAYILARFTFFGNRAILILFIAGLAIPVQLIIIPLFLLYLRIKLVNTLIGLILVYIAVSLPFTIFMLTGFFRTMPKELEDAAVIDGCSEHGVFWRIALPLASPGLVTVSIFNFLGCWNEYLLALVLVNKENAMTVPLGLYNLKVAQQYGANWGAMMAGVVIVLIPTLIGYAVLQNRIARGLTVGALKG